MRTENIQYIRSSITDIPVLLDMRAEFSHELAGQQADELELRVHESNDAYFRRELNRNYFSWHATVDGEAAGMAGMVIREQPGNLKNPSGRWGYLMLVYTKPQYRKRGISQQLVQRLVETARELGIHALELHATAEGEPVYERSGFFKFHEPTYRMFL